MNGAAPPPPPEPLLVRASAGTGKTYQLTRRLIRLLASGEDPRSILAITFTRKAAGEFRERLQATLAQAALEADAANELAAEIDQPHLGPADFRRLLDPLVREPDQLRLATIDGFFFELVRTFPLDLPLPGFSLPPQVAMRSGQEVADDDLELLRSLLRSNPQALVAAATQSTRDEAGGDAPAGRAEELRQWAERLIELSRRTEGRPEVWAALPGDLPRQPFEEAAWQKQVASARATMSAAAPNDESQKVVEEQLDLLASWNGAPPDPIEGEKIGTWLQRVLENPEKYRGGKAYFQPVPRGQRLTVSPALADTLHSLAETYSTFRLEQRERETVEARDIAAALRDAYRDRFLRRGQLGFGDLPYLLGDLGQLDRLLLAYRIDGEIRHWLLDEFQDTSRTQWKVLAPLIDELFHDADTPRSFYCVGDPKQSIYSWRGGDRRLFREIEDQYSQPDYPRPLQPESLAHSYRCAPAIIDFVNALFSDREALAHYEDDENALASWEKDWTPQESAVEGLRGRVECRGAANDEERDRQLVADLQAHRDWEHGTVGLLCRTNQHANHFARLLGQEGLPVVRDGNLRLSVNFPAGRLLTAAFAVLVHPGDSAEHFVLAHSDRQAALAEACGGALTADHLRALWDPDEPDRFFRVLARSLAAHGQLSDAERVAVLALGGEAVRAWRRDRSLEEVLHRLRTAVLPAQGTPGLIQVLTIHRSKGLEYDTVLLPDLGARTNRQPGPDFWIHEEHGTIDAVLRRPRKEECEPFPYLQEWRARYQSEEALEGYCTAYVAMTRASRELRVYFTETQSGQGKQKGPSGVSAWLRAADFPRPPEDAAEGAGEETDDAPFHLVLGEDPPDEPAGAGTAAAPDRPAPVPAAGPPPLPPRHSPSTAARRDPFAGFAATPGEPVAAGLAFGSRVHEVLARHEWPVEECPGAPTGDRALDDYLRAGLAAPALRDALARPRPAPLVWREKAFEVLLDGRWISGVFDRVHLPARWREDPRTVVDLLDYKTDRAEALAEGVPAEYRDQLDLYRRALARILGIDPARIRARLLFLGLAQVEEV
mgnify:FL=1